MDREQHKWNYARFAEGDWTKVVFTATRAYGMHQDMEPTWRTVCEYFTASARGEWMGHVQRWDEIVIFAFKDPTDATYAALLCPGARMSVAKLTRMQRRKLDLGAPSIPLSSRTRAR